MSELPVRHLHGLHHWRALVDLDLRPGDAQVRTIWIILSIPLVAMVIWLIIEMARDIHDSHRFNKECQQFLEELDNDQP